MTTTLPNKGGRPTLPAHVRLSERVTGRFTLDEKLRLAALTEARGTDVSRFLRKLALDALDQEGIVDPCEEADQAAA
jgi:hypothetical protein